jgi:predicted AAA+ superfamily ATPase
MDPGMTNSVLGKTSPGAAVENLLALNYYKLGDLSYWKSDVELDFVIGKAKAAVESKFKKDIDPKEIRGGLLFCKEKKLNKMYVATDDFEGERIINGITVEFVPTARVLLGQAGP